ncbi:MAG: hypothetical protein ACKPGI_13855, partial [Verrucomicrobiota bacterium]
MPAEITERKLRASPNKNQLFSVLIFKAGSSLTPYHWLMPACWRESMRYDLSSTGQSAGH